jgi:hypothetical protein
MIKKLLFALLFLSISSSCFATTYYIRPTSGNDGNAGTSEGAAWATLGKATSLPVAAGDLIYIQSEADFDETLTITASGGNGTPIKWVGYNTTPGDTPAQADHWTIATTNTNGIDTATFDGNQFENITVKDTADDCVTGGNGSDTNRFYNFRFTNCGGDGDGGGDPSTTFWNGEIDNTTGRGIDRNNNGTVTIRSVYIHDTGDDCYFGESSNDNANVYNSVCDTASGSGFEIDGKFNVFIGNTVYNVTGAISDGFDATNTSQASPFLYYNNVVLTAGRYCFKGGTGNTMFDYNAYSGCATSDLSGFTAGSNDVTSAPVFTDAPGGDFTLATGSPLLGAGFPQTLQNAVGDYDVNIGVSQNSIGTAEADPITCTHFF